MIAKGTIVKSDSGRRIRIDGFVTAGGQGEAYWATEMTTGERGVLKVFHKRFINDDTMKRLSFLVDQDLASACPAIRAPTDVINRRNILGHYAPLAPGRPLEEFLANPNITFLEGLQLAIPLAHAVGVMHKRQMAHGDLRAENLLINHVGTVLQLSVIDLDNFNAPRVPPPPMVGENLYLAPELRNAMAHSRPAVPDLCTDRFALGVLMHEIILLRHVAAGHDDNEADFQKAMCSGRWLQDPAAPDRPPGSVGGYPVEVLNADVARLFRSALSLEPAERPSPDVWEVELGRAFNSVYCCPACSGPCVVDISKSACPLCRRLFPHLVLRTADGRAISLEHGSVSVGRNDLGGSTKVSVLHAIFRRVGPETWIESLGSNGSYRWTGTAWVRLPEQKPILVQQGDWLQLGDVQVQLN
jgi:serine/threonine protein kinase